MCRTLFSVISLLLVVSFAGTSYGLVISDFEQGSLDGWQPADSALSVGTTGATSGTGALLIEGPGGWHIHGKLNIKAQRMALAGPGSTVSIDVTAFAADMVTNWMNMEAIINGQNNDDNGANNNIGWQSLGTRDIVRDGLAHTLTWTVPEALSAKIAATDDNILWFELVMVTNNGGTTTKLYVDDIQIPDLPPEAEPAPLGNIILVTEPLDVDQDGVRDDQGLEDWLKAQGYAVDVQPGNWTVLDPNKIAALDAADLVLISRATSSGNYDDSAEEIAAWNGITAPLLDLTAYLVRNNRWKWVNSADAPNNTPTVLLLAVDANHPVFAGVQLDPNDIVEIADPTVGTGLMTFISTLDMGNGKLIAQTADAARAWIAEWPAGVEYYPGAGQVAGGKRMLFCAGTQEVGVTPQGALNLNATGLQMLGNAIAYLLAPEPTAITVVNPSFELPGTVKIKGWNGEGIGGTPAVDIPGWSSDIAVQDSGVETGYTPTDGLWTAFLMGADPSVWQSTGFVIGAQDTFELAVDARNTWQGTTLRMTLYYEDLGLRVPAASADVAVGDAMQTFTLSLAAQDVPAAVGKVLGIEFDNVTANGDSWIGLDNVRLTVK
jgi:hypothetical protein